MQDGAVECTGWRLGGPIRLLPTLTAALSCWVCRRTWRRMTLPRGSPSRAWITQRKSARTSGTPSTVRRKWMWTCSQVSDYWKQLPLWNMKHILKLAYASHPDFYTHAKVIPRVVDRDLGLHRSWPQMSTRLPLPCVFGRNSSREMVAFCLLKPGSEGLVISGTDAPEVLITLVQLLQRCWRKNNHMLYFVSDYSGPGCVLRALHLELIWPSQQLHGADAITVPFYGWGGSWTA